MCWERCWQIFSDVLFHNKGMCAYSVKVFCVALPLKPWILFLWFPLEYCTICIWHWVPTAHTGLSQHEPSWEFVISGCSCTMPKPSSTYFGASPVCWNLLTGANDTDKQAGWNWITHPFSCRWGTRGHVHRCTGCWNVDWYCNPKCFVIRERKVPCASVSVSSRSNPVPLVLLQYILLCSVMYKYISLEEKEIFPFQDLEISVWD